MTGHHQIDWPFLQWTESQDPCFALKCDNVGRGKRRCLRRSERGQLMRTKQQGRLPGGKFTEKLMFGDILETARWDKKGRSLRAEEIAQSKAWMREDQGTGGVSGTECSLMRCRAEGISEAWMLPCRHQATACAAQWGLRASRTFHQWHRTTGLASHRRLESRPQARGACTGQGHTVPRIAPPYSAASGTLLHVFICICAFFCIGIIIYLGLAGFRFDY